MQSCRKLLTLAALALLCEAGFAAKNGDDSKTPSDASATPATPAASPSPSNSGKSSAKSDKSKKDKDKDKEKGKDKKKDQADAGAAATPVEKTINLDFLVAGQPAKGLRIPYGTPGKPTMFFDIGEAVKIDDDHVQMQNMKVDVYAQEEGGHNMSIDLPASVFDVKANTITSHVATTIRRDDFEVTGDSLVFDIKKKKGKLLGHVHMLIYNLNNSVGDEADVDAAAASAPASPAKEK